MDIIQGTAEGTTDNHRVTNKKGKKSKPFKLPKIISREEARRILSIPNVETSIGLRNRTILQILYRAGLRVQEAANLTVDDMNLEKGFVYVQQGKGNKDRYIPMDLETIEWCKRWAEKRKNIISLERDCIWFFPTLKGTQIEQRYIRAMVADYSKKADVYLMNGHRKAVIHPHSLRHTCFTELLEDGLTIREVQEVAGHSSILTTSIYLSIRPEQLAAKMRNRSGLEVNG